MDLERIYDELLQAVGRFGRLALRGRLDKEQQRTIADDLRRVADKLDASLP